ncbi:melanoma-associated antigen B5-like [Rhinolophus ferrumequinum]|uniref:melanoma-associated antigen B5-like n=1 Tax=Rhinolophus ferrumequinum TaxID=59479 RepID=UPI00140F6CDE|nr:melanoma-associated antigen B5-like [Rhinolophus ferrumequinum]
MPRGHKSKQRRQAQRMTQGLQGAQATAAAEEESTPSSPQCEGNTQSVSVVGTCSTSRGPQSTLTTTFTSAGISCPGSVEASHFQDNRVGASEAQPSTESSGANDLSSVALFLERFLLFKYKMKQPIMKEDMLKVVGECYEDKFPEILKRASARIEAIFALDVKEVDSSNHLYDLVSQLKLPNNGRVRAGRGFPKTGLLMNILGLIFMKGNCAAEEDIWKFLNLMRIYAGRKHCIYGEPRKLITKDLVRLQYLEYRQVAGSDPPRYEFLWGPKAHAETSKMKILEFLAKVSDTVPSAFSSHYEEALQEEEEKAHAVRCKLGSHYLLSHTFQGHG